MIIIEILKNALDTFLEMSPYLLFGFLMAGVISALVPAEKVKEHLGKSGILQIIKAAIFGVPLPLCSCSVIPVSASLRKHGASRASVVSFLISAPQTGVDSIMVTWSLLGPIFAIVRPVAAFISGVIGGIFETTFGIQEKKAKEHEHGCKDACCTSKTIGNKLKHVFRHGFVTLPGDIGRALLIGIIIAAFITALVPDDFFAAILGTGIVTMLVMMLVGIPVYVCATASVPIAAALIAKGISPGAALVFLMTGPATNAATISTVWNTMGKRTAVMYLFSVALTALLSGMTLDLIFNMSSAYAVHMHHGWEMPQTAKIACSVILIVVLVRAMIKNLRH